MRFELIVKDGPREIAHVKGRVDVDVELTDLYDNVIRSEQFLEKALGYRFHINQVLEGRHAEKSQA